MGVLVIGVYFLQGGTVDNFTTDLCAKLPRTRIRLALNSRSNSLPRSISLGSGQLPDSETLLP
jgi:hypothetical protein